MSFHISCTPPSTTGYPYMHVTSAFLTTLQFFLRSAQLDTVDVRYRRCGDTAFCCCLGCAAIETVHRVFDQCPALIGAWYKRLVILLQQSRLMQGGQEEKIALAVGADRLVHRELAINTVISQSRWLEEHVYCNPTPSASSESMVKRVKVESCSVRSSLARVGCAVSRPLVHNITNESRRWSCQLGG